MRIVSLLPSATEIISALGLADDLVGRSKECTYPPEILDRPIVTAARIDPIDLESLEIDRLVRAFIVTQDLCAVCAVSSGELGSACPVGAEIVSLDPSTLEDVARSIETLASRLGVPERGIALAAEMRATIDAVRRSTRDLPRPRVFVAEWIEPPFVPGHWLPEMIEAAGGVAILGEPGRPSHRTTWDAVTAADPELLVIAPCGFDAAEAARRCGPVDFGRIAPHARVVVVDGDGFYSRPGPRLAGGVRQLGHLIHPDVVSDPGLELIDLERSLTASRSGR